MIHHAVQYVIGPIIVNQTSELDEALRSAILFEQRHRVVWREEILLGRADKHARQRELRRGVKQSYVSKVVTTGAANRVGEELLDCQCGTAQQLLDILT